MQFSGICSQQVVLVGFWGQDFFGRGQDLQDLQDGQDFLGGQDLQDLQDGQDFFEGGQDLQDLQDGQDFFGGDRICRMDRIFLKGDRICRMDRIYRMDRILSVSYTHLTLPTSDLV